MTHSTHGAYIYGTYQLDLLARIMLAVEVMDYMPCSPLTNAPSSHI
jgi:hypothetical protein